MAELQIEGKIIEIFEKQQVSASFAKREFVVETEDQYPQMVKFELVQNKCDDIDAHNKGDQVSVHFNVRGRKWTNKQGEDVYFVSLNAWRIESKSAQSQTDVPPPTDADVPPFDDLPDDEMPF